MVLLENDNFLSELTRYFQRSKQSGSLTITMKRYDGRTTPQPKDKKDQKGTSSTSHQTTPQEELKCLIRASLGSKKIATVVNQKEMNRFQLAYANVIKANMDGLKKKEKKTKAKTKRKA
ncbi:signal recognition particle 14 kDa protein-like [Tubulanus polymorphus]|uniref:signal recognition particle 14 kDa protein-like n=1 Tax=Tubulanus polymorphus TaxID=672921 RepID=UPI003DA61DB0